MNKLTYEEQAQHIEDLTTDITNLVTAVKAMQYAGTYPIGNTLANAIKNLYRVSDEIKERRLL